MTSADWIQRSPVRDLLVRVALAEGYITLTQAELDSLLLHHPQAVDLADEELFTRRRIVGFMWAKILYLEGKYEEDV